MDAGARSNINVDQQVSGSNVAFKASARPAPISPLVGEMSGRTEGGNPSDEDRDTTSKERPFDPLDCVMSASWNGPKPAILADLSDAPWRTAGDAVERIELLAAKLVSGEQTCPDGWTNTRAVLELAGRPDVEVALGAAVPLVRPLKVAAVTHGPRGLGYAELPEPSRPLSPRSAADLLVAEARRRPMAITTAITPERMTESAAPKGQLKAAPNWL